MNNSKLVSVLLCILLLSGLINAPQILAQSDSPTASSTVIKGQVMDSLTNEVIAYATLNIAKANTPEKPVKMLSSDTDGKFQIALPDTGAFILTSQYIGKVLQQIAVLTVKVFWMIPTNIYKQTDPIPIADTGNTDREN